MNWKIYLAVRAKKPDMVEFLLKKNADANIKNNDGNTARDLGKLLVCMGVYGLLIKWKIIRLYKNLFICNRQTGGNWYFFWFTVLHSLSYLPNLEWIFILLLMRTIQFFYYK